MYSRLVDLRDRQARIKYRWLYEYDLSIEYINAIYLESIHSVTRDALLMTEKFESNLGNYIAWY